MKIKNKEDLIEQIKTKLRPRKIKPGHTVILDPKEVAKAYNGKVKKD